MKSYSDLYDDYTIKYNGKPKYDFIHFITVLSKIHHHRELIRPQIKWWMDTNRLQF